MKEMKIKSIKELKRGDIVRNIASSNSFIIDGVYKDFAIGIRTTHITNPKEWIKIISSNEIIRTYKIDR